MIPNSLARQHFFLSKIQHSKSIFLSKKENENETIRLQGKEKSSQGHFVVYVGKELRRFVVPLSSSKIPPFQQLLDKAAQEFGFPSQNSIVLPCDESTFQSIMEFAATCL
ncbi:hypothetical protein PTKIN_Ptkin07bG0105000 [Pterospermum kingtungense]